MEGDKLDRSKLPGPETNKGLSDLIDATLRDVRREQSEAISRLGTSLTTHEDGSPSAPEAAATPEPEPTSAAESAPANTAPTPAEPSSLASSTLSAPTLRAIAPASAARPTAEPATEAAVFVAVGENGPAPSRRRLLVAIAIVVFAAIVLGWLLFGAHAMNPLAGSPRVTATLVATLTVPVESVAAVAATTAGSRQTNPGTPSASPTSTPENAGPVGRSVATPQLTPPSPLASFARNAASFIASAHSGEMKISYDYGGGTTSTANLLFDLGDAAHPPRLRLSTIYKSPQGSSESDTLMIGNQAWESHDGKTWSEVAARAGIWDQLQSYLPKIPPPENVVARGDNASVQLLWLEGGNEVTLVVDQATSTPTSLQKLNMVTHSRLMVEYLRWNAPVEIGGV